MPPRKRTYPRYVGVESDGKIKLTWPQVVWSLSLLSVILLTYSDVKNKLVTLSSQISNIYTKAEDDRTLFRLEQKDRELTNAVKVINKKLGIDTLGE